MEQARTTISKIFNGEPRTYTRFNLTQNMEGDSSHVEMKLAADADDEAGGNGVGEHRHSNGVHGPYTVRKSARSPLNICFLVSATLLIFIIGYLIGYLVHRKKDLAPPGCLSVDLPVKSQAVDMVFEKGAAPLMDWSDVKGLLAEQLSKAKLEDTFRDLSRESHRAGTPQDDALGNKVLNKFKSYYMDTWADEHFVKVEEPNPNKPNRVTFQGVAEDLGGFLAYSAKGNVTGAIIYANYGQMEDFKKILDIDLSGRVVLVKAGKISFAEKVANAAKLNASAVLVYPDANIGEDTQLYGHVHFGSGDPYTPGFPSFNHTTFAPVKSSGLPSILAQSITSKLAQRIMRNLGGHSSPSEWRDVIKLGDAKDVVTVEVNNVQVEKRINNMLGVIQGFVDPDRYIILGAQRDAWGHGYARSTVGTAVLLELARSISFMVKHGGFKPRRSIVFASWSAGEYGNVGATEWLESYLSSLSMKAFSYINLDGVVTGANGIQASASPLLQTLIETTVMELSTPVKEELKQVNWRPVLKTMQMEDAAFPFLTFSGIPSLSFSFTGTNEYPYFGTVLDTQDRLNTATGNQVSALALAAAQVAGHVTLRLVHDHLLSFDLQRYDRRIHSYTSDITRNLMTLKMNWPELLPKPLTAQWIQSASGSFNRAYKNLLTEIADSQLDDLVMCRKINDRMMQVERNLLSPYVSPRDSPFRHIVTGSGPHTIQALVDHLEAFRLRSPEANVDAFQNQLALATWTVQECANSLAGDIWSLNNDI